MRLTPEQVRMHHARHARVGGVLAITGVWRGVVRIVLVSGALTLLMACGGGGGGGPVALGPVEPPPVAVARPFPRTAPPGAVLNTIDDASYTDRRDAFAASPEYHVRYTVTRGIQTFNATDTHLARINAAAAYARGATGMGETIAIVDTGVRETHREFGGDGKVTKVTQPPGYMPTDAQKSHGTTVAALAAGARDGGSGLNMHGVAYESAIHFTEISLGSGSGVVRPFDLAGEDEEDDLDSADFLGTFVRSASAAGAAILNQSFGVPGSTITRYSRALVRDRLSLTAAALAQADTDEADKTIIVWAAGNAGTQRFPDGVAVPRDAPELWQGLGVYFPELQGHVLAVAAVDQDGTIANYSNHCGVAKTFCLAAPGSDVISASPNADNEYFGGQGYSGTSFAAPLVSGSLALLRQYFRNADGSRQLGNTELVARLLATANRTGIYADSDVYGHGLVDLDAATAPVGMVMTGLPDNPDRRPLAGSGVTLAGGAFGTAVQRQLAGVTVAGFDALGAPFLQSAAGWATMATRRGRFGGVDVERETRALSWSPGGGAARLSPTTGRHGAAARLSPTPGRHAAAARFSPTTGRHAAAAHLSLTTGRHGIVTDARLAFADGWWLSHGWHGGRGLGVYAGARRHTMAAAQFSDPYAFTAPYLALVQDGPGLGFSPADGRFGFALMHGAPRFDGEREMGGARGLGALLSLRLNRAETADGCDSGLWLQAGAVREAAGALGLRAQGAFGGAAGTTTFAGVNGRWRPWRSSAACADDAAAGAAGDWQVVTAAYLGHTRPQFSGGWLRDAGPVLSSAFSLGIARASLWRRDDWFGLRLSQPLRVERGRTTLRLAAGRTKYGEVIHRTHTLNLAPAGRHLQAEAAYHLPLAGGGLRTRIGLERHLQHQRDAGLLPFIELSYRLRF